MGLNHSSLLRPTVRRDAEPLGWISCVYLCLKAWCVFQHLNINYFYCIND